MTNEDFGNRLILKTDEELISIAQNRNGFSEEFLFAAEKILRERGYEINEVEENQEKEAKNITDSHRKYFTYTPILIGILMLVGIQFLPSTYHLSSRAFFENVFVPTIVIELIIGIWSYRLASKFSMMRWLWFFAGLFFGPFSLICLNIAIWIKPVSEK